VNIGGTAAVGKVLQTDYNISADKWNVNIILHRHRNVSTRNVNILFGIENIYLSRIKNQ